MRTSSGEAVGWILSDPLLQINCSSLFLPVLFFLMAPSSKSHQTGCQLKAHIHPRTNQEEGKLQVIRTNEVGPHACQSDPSCACIPYSRADALCMKVGNSAIWGPSELSMRLVQGFMSSFPLKYPWLTFFPALSSNLTVSFSSSSFCSSHFTFPKPSSHLLYLEFYTNPEKEENRNSQPCFRHGESEAVPESQVIRISG